MSCDYAACPKDGRHEDDGWAFCLQHYLEHRADMHGEPWPPMRTVSLFSQAPKAPCGSPAAYKRHQRHGEKPCAASSEAESRRRHPENRDSRRGSWYRPVAS